MRYIITEDQYKLLKFKRNLHQLPNYIRSTYEWLNSRAFNSFDEFLDRVILNTTRDFVADINKDAETFDDKCEIIKPYVKNIVMTEYLDEIRNYYYYEKNS